MTRKSPGPGSLHAKARLDFLRRVYFLKDLSEEEIGLIESNCTEESYGPGDIIFTEGTVADRFYIVEEGEVEVWKNWSDPKPDLLAASSSRSTAP